MPTATMKERVRRTAYKIVRLLANAHAIGQALGDPVPEVAVSVSIEPDIAEAVRDSLAATAPTELLPTGFALGFLLDTTLDRKGCYTLTARIHRKGR